MFQEYFISYRPSYSTANRNTSKSFANGTPLLNKECHDQFKTAAAEKYITLDNGPEFMNVSSFSVEWNNDSNSNAKF